MRKSVRDFLRERLDMTEEDIDRVPPGLEKLVSSRLLRYKIIAEVTEARYCVAGCKVGDKLVVGPGNIVNVGESTCPLCIGALSPMMERVHLTWDRIIEGLNPSEGWVRHLVCFDPGLEGGGLGRVTFKVYAEEVV
jgi:hypothetical protein